MTEPDLTLELVPLCTVRARLGGWHRVGRGPLGTRLVVDVVDARWEGERLRASQVGAAAADWLLVGAGGVSTIDVRMTLRTDDGALVYVAYQGRNRLGADGTPEANYVAPRFETGDERYAWLNAIQAVGKGRLDGDVVTYEMFELR